ncbi:MAG: SDR family NAD(P)-dependent oxidoreductase, partial [Pseudomonadota bacterium]
MFAPGLFDGQRILVTGGGTGLGRAMAAKFLELGAEVVICGRRESVLADTAAELMEAHGGTVEHHALDIRNAAAVDEVIGEIFAVKPLTGLVNNAAGNFIARTEDVSPKGFDAVANIVMRGTFYVTHAVGTRWIKAGQGGSITSILVTWVRNGGPFTVPSAMSKAAIDVMTKSLA